MKQDIIQKNFIIIIPIYPKSAEKAATFIPVFLSSVISILVIVFFVMPQYSKSNKVNLELDQLITTSSKLIGRHQPDITGLIGQYAHGNEPSHNFAYLYNYIGNA